MPSSNAKPAGNLPASLSSFIGREREIREVRNLISTHRLVTLTGAGGSGKSRLALKVARELVNEFEQGVWLVELASIFDPNFVLQSTLSTFNIREQSGQSLMDTLVVYLSGRRVLLVIDNCEHLILACAQLVETLLQKCPELKILTTSREVLGMTGEAAWAVPPLSLPVPQPWIDPTSAQNALGPYEASESVQLFVARAVENSPEFQLTAENGAWVAEICRHLDGMPLAIELAAARVRSLSIQQIAQRLDDRFHLLTSGSRTAPPRQQTLAATLDWSYALLSPPEQKVLQRLSVFAGGATLEAAEIVCSDEAVGSVQVMDTLSHLVDKSLVTADRPQRGEARYRLLETIRQYALEKSTEANQLDASRNRHLHYFIQWAEKAEPHLEEAEQLRWLELYEAEHDNLRTALEWCRTDRGRAKAGLRLAAACGRFWRLRGYISEGRTRLTAALSAESVHERDITRARALTFNANQVYLQSDYPAMRPLVEEALSIWRELGQEGKAGAAYTLDLLGELATEEGDYVSAPAFFQEALEIYQAINHTRGIGQIHMQLGWAAMRTGDLEPAQRHLEEFLVLAQSVEDQTHIAFAYSGLGEVAVRQGQYERATFLLEQALAFNREKGDKWGIGTLLGSLGWVALRQRDFKRVRHLLGESLSVRMEISDKGGIAWCLEKLAEEKYDQAEIREATKIFGQAEALRLPLGSVIDPADRPAYERIVSALQSALGQDVFAALWAEGKAMQLEEVVDCALSEPEPASDSARAQKERFGGLTAREREVALLIVQGKTNREIAKAMTVGVKTIETYVTRILNKLGFDTRVQIATWVVEKGLLSSRNVE